MWLALLGGGAIALVDWVAVWRGQQLVEQIAKPTVMVALALAVATQGPQNAVAWLVVIALMLSLLGDVLLLPVIDDFVGGLAAFLVAHLVLIGAFLVSGVDLGWLVVGAVLALVLMIGAGRPVVQGATLIDERLGRAVVVYVICLAAMSTFGVGTGAASAAVGSALFAGSDAVLGWNRFVESLRHGRLLTHVPYHVGQALIALWAIRM